MKKIVLLSLAAGLLFAGNLAYAANSPVLYFYPAVATKDVGTPFSVSVQLDPQGNNACVFEGTLNFNNLNCRRIDVVPGLMVQMAPTCSNPSFILGVVKCTTREQNLLSVYARGDNPGQGTISVANEKIIGAGAEIASASNQGTYQISDAAMQKPQPLPAEQQTSIPAVSGVAGLSSIASGYFWQLLVIAIAVCAGLAIYRFIILKSRKKDKQ